MRTHRRALAALHAAFLLAASSAGAQSPSPERVAPGAWTFNGSLETGGVGGGYGDVLDKPVDFDLNLAKGRGRWRFGGGLQFGSLVMQPPYEEQEDWSRLETHVFATRVFRHGSRVRPYLQARLAMERVHPRSEIFHVIPPEDFAAGENPTKAANGFGLSLRPGVELDLTPSLALDLSGAFSVYKTGDLSLEAIGKEPVNSGREWALRAGLTWRPLAEGVRALPVPVTDPATGQLAPLPPADGQRDAWGVSRSWGWASAEILGINFVSTALNEYMRGESSYPITPRTIRDNIDEGFKYDDNEFKTNQLVHPFNGGTYFTSARANGIGFWGSSAAALVGAFIWECCGESQPMSWNDMISTGLGGISRGEMSWRLGGLILDNTKTGTRRILREIGALPVNPAGQFNRFISGRATRVQGNPESPYDWRPPTLGMQLAVGARVIGEGESISQNTKTYGLVEFDLQFGSPFENERRKPFDRFDTGFQFNLGDKTRLGRLQVRGDLWSKPLGGPAGEKTRHALAVTQDFDYIDNEAYEYGGQSFGLALFSRFGSGSTRLITRVTGYLVAGAAVNADYSYLADIPDPRELRDYDYGAGVGAGAEMLLTRKRRPLAALSYRYTMIDVKNGSIYNPSDGPAGSSSTHHVHRVSLRVIAPITRRLGVGADAWLFYRDSNYDSPELQDKTQRNPEARLYLSLDLGR